MWIDDFFPCLHFKFLTWFCCNWSFVLSFFWDVPESLTHWGIPKDDYLTTFLKGMNSGHDESVPQWSYYTSSSSFLLLPASLPPFLCWNKVPPGFLALKGQKQTEQWLLELRLQEEGPQGRKKSEGRVGAGKVLCGTFFKPKLTTEDEMFIWGSRKMRKWGLRLERSEEQRWEQPALLNFIHPRLWSSCLHTPPYDITIRLCADYLNISTCVEAPPLMWYHSLNPTATWALLLIPLHPVQTGSDANDNELVGSDAFGSDVISATWSHTSSFLKILDAVWCPQEDVWRVWTVSMIFTTASQSTYKRGGRGIKAANYRARICQKGKEIFFLPKNIFFSFPSLDWRRRHENLFYFDAWWPIMMSEMESGRISRTVFKNQPQIMFELLWWRSSC